MEEKMREYQRQTQRDKQPERTQHQVHNSVPYAYVDVVQSSPSSGSSVKSIDSDYVGPSEASFAFSSGEVSPVSSTGRTASIKPATKPKPKRNASDAEGADTTSAVKTG